MYWLKRNWLFILIPIVGILTITDIYLRYNSSWSFTIRESTIFNNIVTPVATIVSIGIYAWTLIVLIQQNSVLRRQNNRNSFERYIDDLDQEFKEVFDYYHLPKSLGVNKYNMLDWIFDMLTKLYKAKEYENDVNTLTNGGAISVKDFKNRSYFSTISAINTLVSQILPYARITLLLRNIRQADLERIDSDFLIKVISKKFLKPYTSFLESQEIISELSYFPYIIEDKEGLESVALIKIADCALATQYKLVKISLSY